MKFTDTSRIRSQFDQRMTTRDGVELSADIYRPAEPGDYPVLVTRTPYDNNHADGRPPTSTAPQVPADRFKLLAAHGFVVVAGDVRGRGDSDGAFVPFRHEADDGADVLAWARELPESDGRVGVFGAGYAGFAALAAATATPVDAVAAWSPFGLGEGLPARGGAVRLEWLLWMHLVGGRVRGPVDVPDWDEIHRSAPLSGMHEVLGRSDASWPHWLDHHDPADSYWDPLRLESRLAELNAPVLLVSGWWDTNLDATLRYWSAVSQRGAVGHRLVLGPWDTARTRRPTTEFGGVEWGPAAVLDPEQVLIDWFGENLGNETSRPKPPACSVFVTGDNAWNRHESWPPPSDAETHWLTSGGCANTRVGDGRLDVTPPRGARADSFIHDPGDPVHWQPEVVSFSRSHGSSFSLGSAHATGRDDTLCYASAPVSAPRRYSGTPRLHLVVETDAEDADWFAVLEDVFPDGARSVALSHGALRAATHPDFRPDHPVTLEVSLTPLTHELQPGHALRIVVTSSLFPLYAVNLGGNDYLHGTARHRSRHVVHHGPGCPSRLVLPLVRI